MILNELREMILENICDITFKYKGVYACINPCTNHDIEVGYGENIKRYTDVDELLNDKFYDGKSLAEICETLEIERI